MTAEEKIIYSQSSCTGKEERPNQNWSLFLESSLFLSFIQLLIFFSKGLVPFE